MSYIRMCEVSEEILLKVNEHHKDNLFGRPDTASNHSHN